jgi:hypothetical protein
VALAGALGAVGLALVASVGVVADLAVAEQVALGK